MIERLLDSVILIDHLNAFPRATEFLMSLDPEKTAISVQSERRGQFGIPDPSLRRAQLARIRTMSL